MSLSAIRPIGVILVVVAMFLVLTAPAALAGEGGVPGPCAAGTPLEGENLGQDVSFWFARQGLTPIPDHFAFDPEDPPLPPGQLMKFARENGLC